MKANILVALIWLAAGLIAYARLPELVQDMTRDWHPWMLSMVFTSAALVVGGVVAVACLVSLAMFDRPEQRKR